MSDFYNTLHRNAQPARHDLPVNRTSRAAAPANANDIMMSTNSKIEAAKQDLYEKIDVCCAQYGLYGLNVISNAISESLSRMINGMSSRPTQYYQQASAPQIPPQAAAQQWQPAAQAPVEESYAAPHQARFGTESFTDDFMANIGTIFDACDADANAKAEEQIKARLYEQKQLDIIAEQQKAEQKALTEADLEAAADDYNLVATENLHNV